MCNFDVYKVLPVRQNIYPEYAEIWYIVPTMIFFLLWGILDALHVINFIDNKWNVQIENVLYFIYFLCIIHFVFRYFSTIQIE